MLAMNAHPLVLATAFPSPLPSPAVALGQETPGSRGAVAAVIGGIALVGVAWYAAMSYVGWRTASRDKGFPRVLGYVVGIGGGYAALLFLMGALGAAAAGVRSSSENRVPVM